jgi:hypothetical protein
MATNPLYQTEKKGDSVKITDASGNKTTVTQQAIDRLGIDAFVDSNGNAISARDRGTAQGRRYKEDDSVWQTPEDRMVKTKSNIKGVIRAGGNANFVDRISTPTTQPATPPATQLPAQPTGEAATINKSYEDQKNALVQRIRETVLQGTQAQQNIISKAPQQFNPLRAQVDINSSRGLQNIKETLANQGNIGAGLGRQEMIQADALRQNQQNSINLDQQSIIDQANQQILTLQSEGRMTEAQAVSDNAMAKLQALIESNRRTEDNAFRDSQVAYQQKRDKIEDAFRQGQIDEDQRRYELDQLDAEDDEQYNREQDTADNEREIQNAALENFIASIDAYSNDYQAKINELSAVNPNDPRIPFLQARRNEKIAQQKAEADQSASQAYKNAYELWQEYGTATAQMASLLGVPEGAKTQKQVEAEYKTSKPYYNPSTGGSNSGNGLSW